MSLLIHFCPLSIRTNFFLLKSPRLPWNWSTEPLQLPHVKDGQKEGRACINATVSCSESHRCHLTDWLPPPSPWPFPSTPGSWGSGLFFHSPQSPLSTPCVTAVCLLTRPLIPHRTLFPGWLGPLCHSHTHAVFLRKTACSEAFTRLFWDSLEASCPCASQCPLPSQCLPLPPRLRSHI